jgi:hypothetical protein
MVKIESRWWRQGGSICTTIPIPFADHLGIKEIEEEGRLESQDENGKKGNFISVWKKKA